jgi:hypothetical protein
MSATNGKFSHATRSGPFRLTGELTVARLALLVTLGVLVVLLERSFRWSLQLPGHHGLEAMALLTMGRLMCTNRWSATVVATSAAATAAVTGADHGVLMPVLYVLPGLVLDAGYALRPAVRAAGLYLPVIAGLAFASKPALRCLTHATLGLDFGSLRYGPLVPLVTHLGFGFVGGLIAVLLWRAAERAAGPEHPPAPRA